MGGATLELLVAERRLDVADGLVAERIAGRLHQLTESMPARRIDGTLQRHADAVDRLARHTTQPGLRAALLRALVQTQSSGASWPHSTLVTSVRPGPASGSPSERPISSAIRCWRRWCASG
jgi:hypothetical protein